MKIFLSGQTNRGEFQAVVSDVDEIAARVGAKVETRESIANVENEPGYPAFLRDVDFFVLCRSFPNEFRARDVEALRRAAPLAPITLVAGTLCEGENRTGESLPGVRRFYFDAWRNVGRIEFARFFEPDGAQGIFAASPLASAVDLLAERCSCPALNSFEHVLILSDDSAMRALLKDAFEESGAETQVERLERDFGCAATPERVVVDSPDLAASDFLRTFERLQARFPDARFDVLAFAPRFDEIKALETSKNIRVVAKPFDSRRLTERQDKTTRLTLSGCSCSGVF